MQPATDAQTNSVLSTLREQLVERSLIAVVKGFPTLVPGTAVHLRTGWGRLFPPATASYEPEPTRDDVGPISGRLGAVRKLLGDTTGVGKLYQILGEEAIRVLGGVVDVPLGWYVKKVRLTTVVRVGVEWVEVKGDGCGGVVRRKFKIPVEGVVLVGVPWGETVVNKSVAVTITPEWVGESVGVEILVGRVDGTKWHDVVPLTRRLDVWVVLNEKVETVFANKIKLKETPRGFTGTILVTLNGVSLEARGTTSHIPYASLTTQPVRFTILSSLQGTITTTTPDPYFSLFSSVHPHPLPTPPSPPVYLHFTRSDIPSLPSIFLYKNGTVTPSAYCFIEGKEKEGEGIYFDERGVWYLKAVDPVKYLEKLVGW